MPTPPCPKTCTPSGLEVRYARSFLLDIEGLEADARHQVLHFIFEEFHRCHPLHDLPEFHQLTAHSIFYRFTLDQYLIGLEITGQLVKFLRILPKPGL